MYANVGVLLSLKLYNMLLFKITILSFHYSPRMKTEVCDKTTA